MLEIKFSFHTGYSNENDIKNYFKIHKHFAPKSLYYIDRLLYEFGAFPILLNRYFRKNRDYTNISTYYESELKKHITFINTYYTNSRYKKNIQGTRSIDIVHNNYEVYKLMENNKEWINNLKIGKSINITKLNTFLMDKNILHKYINMINNLYVKFNECDFYFNSDKLVKNHLYFLDSNINIENINTEEDIYINNFKSFLKCNINIKSNHKELHIDSRSAININSVNAFITLNNCEKDIFEYSRINATNEGIRIINSDIRTTLFKGNIKSFSIDNKSSYFGSIFWGLRTKKLKSSKSFMWYYWLTGGKYNKYKEI